MDIIQARVKYTAGKVFEGQYGESINAAFTTAEGKDVRVYGKPDDEKLKSLKKDDQVTLIYDGKSYKVAYDMKTANQVEPPVKAEATQEAKPFQRSGKLTEEELTEKATYLTGMYADIFHQLQASGLEAEQAQPAAATIFIQLGKFL